MSAMAEATDDVDLPQLHVGDHVVDREDPDATLVVMGVTATTAAETAVGTETTVADCNAGYPADDHVVEAVYPDRSSVDLEGQTRYSFPRSRLQLAAAVHERDGGDA